MKIMNIDNVKISETNVLERHFKGHIERKFDGILFYTFWVED